MKEQRTSNRSIVSTTLLSTATKGLLRGVANTYSLVMAHSNTASRAIHTTPATTNVAAWMTADTAVGPSIASGSQLCRPTVTLLTATIASSILSSKLAAAYKRLVRNHTASLTAKTTEASLALLLLRHTP